jgi:hypothetical protein
VGRKFWATPPTAPDQLRKRTAFALHQILMVSQADSNLYHHSRAYAAYMDVLNKHAFGNFRNLLEDIALSPAMGIYLSHMRNRKEDPASGRMPDENFARELMQLFTIGLHELNADGTVVRNAAGQPVETYNNADVMALARVFTGWSWAFPDAQMTTATSLGRTELQRRGGHGHRPAADEAISDAAFERREAALRGQAVGGNDRCQRHRQERSEDRAGHAVQPPQRRTVHRPPADPAPGVEQPEPGLCRPCRGRLRQQRRRRSRRPRRGGARHRARQRSSGIAGG